MAYDWTYTDAFIGAGTGAPLDTEVIEELKNNILAGSGEKGTGSFSGDTSGTLVTLTTAMSDTSYTVLVTPSADPGGKLGEVWVTVLTTTTFRVYNSGKATTGFMWRAFP